jgi:hypothetical protein
MSNVHSTIIVGIITQNMFLEEGLGVSCFSLFRLRYTWWQYNDNVTDSSTTIDAAISFLHCTSHYSSTKPYQNRYYDQIIIVII